MFYPAPERLKGYFEQQNPPGRFLCRDSGSVISVISVISDNLFPFLSGLLVKVLTGLAKLINGFCWRVSWELGWLGILLRRLARLLVRPASATSSPRLCSPSCSAAPLCWPPLRGALPRSPSACHASHQPAPLTMTLL